MSSPEDQSRGCWWVIGWASVCLGIGIMAGPGWGFVWFGLPIVAAITIDAHTD